MNNLQQVQFETIRLMEIGCDFATHGLVKAV